MPEIPVWLGLLLVVATYGVIRMIAMRVLRLERDDFRQESLVLSVLRRPTALVGVIAFTAPALVSASYGWEGLGSLGARVFISVVALTVAWTLVAAHFDPCFSTWRWPDRLLVGFSAAAIVFEPGFAAPMIVGAHLLKRSLTHCPAVPASETEKNLLDELIMLCAAYAMLRPLGVAPVHFLGAGLAFIGAYYFWPGVTKLTIGPRPWTWALHNPLHNLVLSSWCYGFLASLSEDAMRRYARLVRRVRVPILVSTVLLELGAIVVLADPRLAIMICAGCSIMHLAIFATCGFLFWRWIVTDAAMIAAILLLPADVRSSMFGVGPVVAGALVVVSARVIAHPPTLVWFDAPFVNRIVVEVVDEFGVGRTLSPLLVSPYDLSFAQGRFWALPDTPLLVGIYGNLRRPDLDITSFELLREIEATQGDPGAIEALKRRRGLNRHDPVKADLWDRFMFYLIKGVHGHRRRRNPFTPLHHFWHDTRPPMHSVEHTPLMLRVRLIEQFHDDRGVRTVSNRVIREVLLDDLQAVAA